MTHVENTNYSFCRTKSKVDGTPIQDILNLYNSKSVSKFGTENTISQDGLAIVIDCNCQTSWLEHVKIEQRLEEFFFESNDRPVYLPVGCEDSTQQEATLILESQGSYGEAYFPVSEIGGL